MNEAFIRERITELRLKKGVSEYQMSLELGHSKGYIQGITCGRSLPSLGEFLYICEYFGIEPKQFFDAGTAYPASVNELSEIAASLSSDDLSAIIAMAKRLTHGNQQNRGV